MRQADAMTDTAIRRVKLNTVLRYGYEIYNARLDGSKHPNIQIKIRVFRDGKLVLDGQQLALDLQGQTEMERLKASGALSLGGKMLPGDYILQVIVTDNLAPQNRRLATQYIQFEVEL